MVGASSRLLSLVTNPISLIHHRPSVLHHLARRHTLTIPLRTLSNAPNHMLRLSSPTSAIRISFCQKFYSRATNSALQEKKHITASDYHARPSHTWPEWSRLLESLSVSGYFNGNRNIDDEFVANENLSMDFVAAANSCLAFARDRPDILRWLSRKDIEVLIGDGYPFLFKSAQETERRMRSFLQAVELNEASTVDLMKYILSYASNPIIYPERNINEATETSVRILLQEMTNLSCRDQATEQFQAVGRDDERMQRNLGPDITMKKGDWICSICSFMNFARNSKCLECEEPRPPRQLIDGNWDCPQCNFFNYRRNVVCLKCECKRPDVGQLSGPPGQTINPHYQNTYGNNSTPGVNNFQATNNLDTSNHYPANSSRISGTSEIEDKTARWFKKVKDLHGVTEFRDDFPQIMPAKGETRSVDSKKKDKPYPTHQRQQISSSFAPFVPFPPGYFAKKDHQQQPGITDSTVKETHTDNSNNSVPDKNLVQDTGNQFRRQETGADKSNFGQRTPDTMNVRSGWTGKSLEGSAVTEADPLDMSEEAKAERWFRRVAQIKDISELSQIPDEDFPSIMPMRKGVNRFVVSKRKTPLERRLTSPQYRKNLRIMSSESVKKEGDDDN